MTLAELVSFNSTLVRFNRFAPIAAAINEGVSIPLWFDSTSGSRDDAANDEVSIPLWFDSTVSR